jgi:hypothetical protein
MLLLSKLAALGIIIWFYMTAEKNGQPTTKWVAIGLIGYLLGWFILDLIIDKTFAAALTRRSGGAFVLGQIPTLSGLLMAFFVRKKLLNNIKTGS